MGGGGIIRLIRSSVDTGSAGGPCCTGYIRVFRTLAAVLGNIALVPLPCTLQLIFPAHFQKYLAVACGSQFNSALYSISKLSTK